MDIFTMCNSHTKAGSGVGSGVNFLGIIYTPGWDGGI